MAIKEASFDPLRWLALKAHLNAAPRKITLLTGNDNFIAESFLLGAEGALLGFATLLTAEHVALQAAVRAGDVATASDLGKRIQDLADIIFAAPVADYRARTKEALAMMGWIPNTIVRPPLLQVDDADRARIRAGLVAAGLLGYAASWADAGPRPGGGFRCPACPRRDFVPPSSLGDGVRR